MREFPQEMLFNVKAVLSRSYFVLKLFCAKVVLCRRYFGLKLFCLYPFLKEITTRKYGTHIKIHPGIYDVYIYKKKYSRYKRLYIRKGRRERSKIIFLILYYLCCLQGDYKGSLCREILTL